MEKKTAARRAAAKYSTDLILATNEFAKLIYPSEQLPKDKFDELQQEMLFLLPPYRHPVRYPFLEEMYFVNPDCIKVHGEAFSFPPFYPDLEKIVVEPLILKAVDSYIRKAELNKIKLLELQKKIDSLFQGNQL